MRRRLGPRLAVAFSVALVTAATAAGQVAKPGEPPKDNADVKNVVTKEVTVEKELEAKTNELVKKELEVIARELQEKVKADARNAARAVPPAQIKGGAVKFVDVNNLVPQFTQQFRPILLAEYELVLSVCKPDKAARKLIARAGEKGLTEGATLVAAWQSGRRTANSPSPDPRKAIQDALVDVVNEKLPADVAARYVAESKQRMKEQREVSLNNLVAKFDQLLNLTADQREQLAGSLEKQWTDEWSQSIQLYLFEDAFFPIIPDTVVVPILSPAQKSVWGTAQRARRYLWGGYVNGMQPIPNPLPDTELDTDGPNDAKAVPGLPIEKGAAVR